MLWLVNAAAVAVATVLFFWLLVVTFTTRALILRAQSEIEMAPDATEALADKRRLLSFAVVLSPAALGALGQPPARWTDAALCLCGAAGAQVTGLHQRAYTRTAWLPLRADAGASALASAVAAGNVRYLAIAGAIVRVAMVAGDAGAPSGLLLMDMTSFDAPEGCTPLVPVPALPDTRSTTDSWADLLSLLFVGATPMHVLGW